MFPVCLPPPIENDIVTDYTGQEVFVTGYGCTDEKCSFGDLSQQLQEISIEVISNDLAMCWFLNNSRVDAGSQEYVPKQLFVTGGFLNGDPTTCQVRLLYLFFLSYFSLTRSNLLQGDSGSPIVREIPAPNERVRFEVIGVVSWSKGCGRKFRPSVWTRIETQVSWIHGQIEENERRTDIPFA